MSNNFKGSYPILMLICLPWLCLAQIDSVGVADSLYINGNFSKAIEIYEKQADDKTVFSKLAKAYTAIGNYDEALDHYKVSIEKNPDDALLKYEYAKLLSKTKQFEIAKGVYAKLLDVDDTNPNYHYEMGLVLEKLNDSLSMHRFRRAYDLDKNHQKAIFKIAKFYLQKRSHDLSHRYIDQGLAGYKNNVELISLKAQNYYWQQKYHNAITWFNKLLSLGEISEFIYEKLSLSYYNVYDYENAIKHRKNMLQRNPFDAVSKYVIGTYYEQLDQLDLATEYITKALLILDKPMDAEYTKLGTIYNRRKMYPLAIESFKTALDENPQAYSSAFYLARAKEEYYADMDQKIKVYEQYKLKYPESPLNMLADMRLKILKEEKFMKGKQQDSTSEN